MPRVLFRDVAAPSVRVGSRAGYIVPLSVAAHVLVCAGIFVAPLVATDALPVPQTMLAFAAPAPPPVPPPPPAPVAAAARRARAATVNPHAAPREAPPAIVPERAPLVPDGVPLGVQGGLPAGQIGGVHVDVPVAPPAPPSLRPAAGPVRIGGAIRPPEKVRHVNPVYPRFAREARVQGVVVIDATIGPDGRVADARVVTSVPLLDQAALDAVSQWRFTPTLLNGVPVPVVMTVRVSFLLQ